MLVGQKLSVDSRTDVRRSFANLDLGLSNPEVRYVVAVDLSDVHDALEGIRVHRPVVRLREQLVMWLDGLDLGYVVVRVALSAHFACEALGPRHRLWLVLDRCITDALVSGGHN